MLFLKTVWELRLQEGDTTTVFDSPITTYLSIANVPVEASCQQESNGTTLLGFPLDTDQPARCLLIMRMKDLSPNMKLN